MKLIYDTDTDSLYIDLIEQAGVSAREIAEGVVIDTNAEGKIVGIDIQHASTIIDLTTLDTGQLPLESA